MGWYGDYANVDEVLNENVHFFGRNERYTVVDTKKTKSYGMILLKNDFDNSHDLFCFIFHDGMYKIIDFLNDYNYFRFIPSSWINKLTTDSQLKAIKHQKDIIKNQKKQKALQPKLEDILVRGKTYKIWDEHVAVFKYKEKRSFIFEKDGRLTKFTSLKYSDVKEV